MRTSRGSLVNASRRLVGLTADDRSRKIKRGAARDRPTIFTLTRNPRQKSFFTVIAQVRGLPGEP
jgi:hypothetical protein